MSMPKRFYEAEQMSKIGKFLGGLQNLLKDLEGDPDDISQNLYIAHVEIVIRHRDDYTVGRIGNDDGDYLFFELTEEDYSVQQILSQTARDAIAAHTRQEDTASGHPHLPHFVQDVN